VNIAAAPGATYDEPAPSGARALPCLARDELEELFRASVSEFFEAYGVACAPRLPDEPAPSASCVELGSIAALRGRAIDGSLTFVAPVDLVARMYPAAGNTGTDKQLRDWCAEVANQLVGRLKNKLAAHHIDFEVGIPVCFSGRSIRLVFQPDAEGLSLLLRADGHAVRVHLDYSLEPVPMLSGGAVARPPRVRIAAEGDVLLF
jgi:CheY-specific phosphatase CheX